MLLDIVLLALLALIGQNDVAIAMVAMEWAGSTMKIVTTSSSDVEITCTHANAKRSVSHACHIRNMIHDSIYYIRVLLIMCGEVAVRDYPMRDGAF